MSNLITPFSPTTKEKTTFQKVLLIGKAGSGKSSFASSFPKPLLVIDLDKAIQSNNKGSYSTKSENELFFTQPDSNKEGYQTFKKILNELRGRADMLKAYEAIQTGCEEEKAYRLCSVARTLLGSSYETIKATKQNPFPYKTIIIDSLTFLIDMVRDHVTPDNKQSPTMADAQSRANGFLIIGLTQDNMATILRDLKALPVNLVITAHIKDKTKTDSDGKEVVIGYELDCSPKLSTKIHALMDTIISTDVIVGSTISYKIKIKPTSELPWIKIRSVVDVNSLKSSTITLSRPGTGYQEFLTATEV